MNKNVSYAASEGANCKWKFSVWSTELFLYVVDLQSKKRGDTAKRNNMFLVGNVHPVNPISVFLKTVFNETVFVHRL